MKKGKLGEYCFLVVILLVLMSLILVTVKTKKEMTKLMTSVQKGLEAKIAKDGFTTRKAIADLTNHTAASTKRKVTSKKVTSLPKKVPKKESGDIFEIKFGNRTDYVKVLIEGKEKMELKKNEKESIFFSPGKHNILIEYFKNGKKFLRQPGTLQSKGERVVFKTLD